MKNRKNKKEKDFQSVTGLKDGVTPTASYKI
jgi:hypothetical protein